MHTPLEVLLLTMGVGGGVLSLLFRGKVKGAVTAGTLSPLSLPVKPPRSLFWLQVTGMVSNQDSRGQVFIVAEGVTFSSRIEGLPPSCHPAFTSLARNDVRPQESIRETHEKGTWRVYLVRDPGHQPCF